MTVCTWYSWKAVLSRIPCITFLPSKTRFAIQSLKIVIFLLVMYNSLQLNMLRNYFLCLRQALTRCVMTCVINSPFSPFSPGSPLSPLLPSTPGGPCGPGGPIGPGSPLSPATGSFAATISCQHISDTICFYIKMFNLLFFYLSLLYVWYSINIYKCIFTQFSYYIY